MYARKNRRLVEASYFTLRSLDAMREIIVLMDTDGSFKQLEKCSRLGVYPVAVDVVPISSVLISIWEI
ncbi:hypothetical protein GTO27_12610 [Candidatus Bathyarchaeota archaeon]|nr:hypothetical protein [Candidatus Bathyarchaeota archaeon]